VTKVLKQTSLCGVNTDPKYKFQSAEKQSIATGSDRNHIFYMSQHSTKLNTTDQLRVAGGQKMRCSCQPKTWVYGKHRTTCITL